MKNINEIIAKAKEVTLAGLPFMEGREKGDLNDLIDTTVVIKDYGYMEDVDKNGEVKEYASFIIEGNDQEFFFGGQVLTDNLKKLEEVLTDKELEQLLENGISVALGKKKSKKKKREYTTCTFFPNAE